MAPVSKFVPSHPMQGSHSALKFAIRDLPNLNRVLKLVPGRTAVVQAGACLGVFPEFLAKRFKTVYTFEPAADLFRIMLQNVPLDNIVRFQAALGCERGLVGTARVRRCGSPGRDHEGITHIVPQGTVPTLQIDDLALPVCDLIYLDLEGYELNALRGAVDTLQRCRPVVAIEVNKNLHYMGLTREEVMGFVQSQGYVHKMTVGSDEAFIPVERAA